MKRFCFSKIKEFRESLGLSQLTLAGRIATTQQQVQAWERGRGNNMTIKSLARLCKALGRDQDEFFLKGDE